MLAAVDVEVAVDVAVDVAVGCFLLFAAWHKPTPYTSPSRSLTDPAPTH